MQGLKEAHCLKEPRLRQKEHHHLLLIRYYWFAPALTGLNFTNTFWLVKAVPVRVNESVYVPAVVVENLNPAAGPTITAAPDNPETLNVKDLFALRPATQVVSNVGSEETEGTNTALETETASEETSDIPQLF